jgi:hypothetical protein
VLISVAGGLPFGVAYTLDGAVHNDPQSNSNLPMPFPDALQEFRVATSGLSAQNGVKSGGSVSAVTKSGANTFSGDAFEFLRDHRFNAPAHFASFGPDGKQVDDGLKRSQFGGTLGGPIVRNKLFFFGGFQGTIARSVPSDNISFVPTAQMLAGDFTTITSPACTGGRQINLGAPFVGNRVNPALFSPAALKLIGMLPPATNACGQITWQASSKENDYQPIGRIDYQLSQSQQIYGRYMQSKALNPPSWSGPGDDILKTATSGGNSVLHGVALGYTQVLSASVVNAVHGTGNYTSLKRYQPDGFPSPRDLGVNMYVYPPANQTSLSVTGGFSIETGTATQRTTYNKLFAVSDDLTVVKGSHQLGFGGNVQRWRLNSLSTSRTGGVWTFDGSLTGLGLADLMMGRVARLEIGGPNVLLVHAMYLGTYAQDAWRISNRATFNYGVRWEPYTGQTVENGAIMAFSQSNFDQNIRSKVYVNAPPGIIYPGDPGFPPGQTGLKKQWRNFAPRLGFAWDVHGDGRLAVRSSYSLGYDFEAGEYHNINAGSPPFGNRSILNDPAGLMDNPWAALGGDPHPIVTGPNVAFIQAGAFGVMNPDINSPRVQQWNLEVEQQLGKNWGVSAAYLGSYSDRLWAQTALNPGVYLGTGPCVLNGVSYPVCSTTTNLDQRRVLELKDPVKAAGIGALDLNSDVGWQKYRGLKLSATRRGADFSINGSYTLSRCVGTPTTTAFNQISSGYTDPAHPNVDAGYCDQNRTHLGTLNLAYQTPEFGNGALHVIAANWRVGGILNARSGDMLNVTSGKDNAFNGISAQRPNLVSGQDPYGAGKSASSPAAGVSIDNYLNRAAFAQPANGTLGNVPYNYAVGPAVWQVNMAISRFVSFGKRRMELRLESFNLLNHFNWGDPVVNFNSSTFGKITTQAGDPRIMQFGIKYDF